PTASPTTADDDARPPPDVPSRPLSTYRKQRAWVRAHANDPRAAELARRLETKARRSLVTCDKFKIRPKCYWASETTLLVLTQDGIGPYVVDMDTTSPWPVPLPRLKPTMYGCFSGALHRRDGSVRWIVGAQRNVYLIEGDPR